MKYSRLTKEQFEELHQEFAKFLATQSITADEWKKLKQEKPDVAEDELDVFSDLIWEGVLATAEYLENLSPSQLFLFKLTTSDMKLIVVKLNNSEADLTTAAGLKWLEENLKHPNVELFTASKVYSEERNLEIFNLIKQGAVISKGDLYKAIATVL